MFVAGGYGYRVRDPGHGHRIGRIVGRSRIAKLAHVVFPPAGGCSRSAAGASKLGSGGDAAGTHRSGDAGNRIRARRRDSAVTMFTDIVPTPTADGSTHLPGAR